MSDQRHPTRPERLAAERRAAARELARTAARPSLNPRFPYRAIPFDPAPFSARPLWAVERTGTAE